MLLDYINLTLLLPLSIYNLLRISVKLVATNISFIHFVLSVKKILNVYQM